MLHAGLSWIVPFEPFLTRTEVCKVGVTHFMTMDDAKDLVGYAPVLPQEEAIKRTAAHFSPAVHSTAKRNQALLIQVALVVVACLFAWIQFGIIKGLLF